MKEITKSKKPTMRRFVHFLIRGVTKDIEYIQYDKSIMVIVNKDK